MDFTDRIERLEVFEERVGCRLEALYCEFTKLGSSNYITINGEVHGREGANISKSFILKISIYDDAGRLIAESAAGHWSVEKFFGFATFSATVMVAGELTPVKVRLIPNAK